MGWIFLFTDFLYHFLLSDNEWYNSLYPMLSVIGISWRYIKDISLWGCQWCNQTTSEGKIFRLIALHLVVQKFFGHAKSILLSFMYIKVSYLFWNVLYLFLIKLWFCYGSPIYALPSSIYISLLIVLLWWQVTEECLERGIAVCKDGASFKKIGKRIRFASPPCDMLDKNRL